jgi:hypothetical protein
MLGDGSRTTILLKPGLRLTLDMVEFSPLKHWQWAGRVFGMKIQHAQHFEALDATSTRLTWTALGEGLVGRTLGRLFAAVYGLMLDRAIRRLTWELTVYHNPDPTAAYRAI